MANLFWNPTEANSAITSLVARPDAGAAAGSVEIRTGPSPGTGNPATGTLLATLPLNDPAFSVTAEVATIQTATPVEDTNADATGTAEHARFLDSDSNVAFDTTVGGTGSGAGIELNNTSITAGQTVTVTGGTITIPVGP